MLNCKEVTEIASQSLDRDLPFWTRFNLRVHLMMCNMCSSYVNQLKVIRSSMNNYTDKVSNNLKLSRDAQKRIQAKLEQSNKK